MWLLIAIRLLGRRLGVDSEVTVVQQVLNGMFIEERRMSFGE